MKRLLALLAASWMAVAGLNAQYRNPVQDLEDSETVRAFKEHVATLSAAQMEGRKAGSEGEKMAADYLEAQLKSYGIDILSSGAEFKVAGADTLTSRNVVGFLQGWDKAQNGRYIVIGARMDNLGMDTYTQDGVYSGHQHIRRSRSGCKHPCSWLLIKLNNLCQHWPAAHC